MKHPDRVAEPLVGGYVASASLPGKGDLSDWVELMEVVEALCPVWPAGRHQMVKQSEFKL
ncbi:hypothetical protein ACVCL3_16920 [Rhodanobacter sp. UC4437_H4]